MGILDAFIKPKKDPEVEAAERRAYEKEVEIVHREKKRAAVKEAAERGRAKARGTQKSSALETAKKIKGAGEKIWAGGQFVASHLNMDQGVGFPMQQEPPGYPKRGSSDNPYIRKRGKGKKKKQAPQAQQQYQDPFAMPEFQF